jgi:DNA-binding CsgD family transcriptional regulator
MSLELGWTELGAGRWQSARAVFAAAAPDAEALEGLSWAAWWLDDAKAVFDCREQAYRLYRADGNDAAAARMATWLASDHLDFHGAAAVARGWRRRARRLLEPLEAGPDHGWLAFHEGYAAYAAGALAEARDSAVAAADLGRGFGVVDLEMLGLALEGATLVADAQVDAGMRRLDEATAVALAGESTIAISRAWTCCFLVGACTAVRDYERAVEWCDRIAEFAERYESRYMLGFCRAEYGAVELWRGRWAEAEKLLTGSIDSFGRSRPAYASGPITQLAELRRRQGRTADAISLLETAGGSFNGQLCRARLALDGGDARGARSVLERLRRGDPGPRDAAVLELLVRAALQLGDADGAAEAAAELRALADVIATDALLAAAALAQGLVAAETGAAEPARALLEEAVARYELAGAPYETASAAAALAGLGANAAGVTRREREVLMLLAEGLTNRQIADRLVLSEHTVHRHVSNILRKLDLPSRAAAAAHAARAGL